MRRRIWIRIPFRFWERARYLACFFLARVQRTKPFNPPQLPFNPQFRPFTAFYLTNPDKRAILSRVRQAPSLPDSCFLLPPNLCFYPDHLKEPIQGIL